MLYELRRYDVAPTKLAEQRERERHRLERERGRTPGGEGVWRDERAPGVSCGHEVRRTDAAARPVPEGERCHRSRGLLHVGPRRPVGRCDFEHSQPSVAA